MCKTKKYVDPIFYKTSWDILFSSFHNLSFKSAANSNSSRNNSKLQSICMEQLISALINGSSFDCKNVNAIFSERNSRPLSLSYFI